MLIQEDWLDNNFKIRDKTNTTSPSKKNEDWKKFKVWKEKVNVLKQDISMDQITKLNELIYGRAKQFSDKIGISKKKKPNRNTNPDGNWGK